MQNFNTTKSAFIAALFTVSVIASPLLHERQGVVVGCAKTRETRIVGDGNPHTDALHKQVTSTNSCFKGDCSVSFDQGKSFTIGFSVDLNPFPEEWDFISAGFDVSKEVSTGQTSTCEAGPDESVCIWKYIPHTAYTVREWETSNCQESGRWVGDEHIMRSPVANAVSEYCVRGPCRKIGDQYWEYTV